MQPTKQHFDIKMFLIIQKVSLLAIIVHLFFIGLFYWFNYTLLSTLNIFFTLIWLAGYIVNNKGKPHLAILIINIEVLIHSAINVTILGWESGFQYYLLTTLIFNVLRKDIKALETIILSTLFIGFFVALHTLSNSITYVYDDPLFIEMMYYNNVLMALILMSLIGYFFKQETSNNEKEAHLLANTDFLTGLQTRRTLQRDVEGDINRSLEDKQQSVVILSDIDNFKMINDTYGHDNGDIVLKEIAQRLKENLRYGDKVYRWGGEEFLIILQNISVIDAKKIAQTIRNDVRTAIFYFNSHELNVSMTFGVACLNQSNPEMDKVIKEADQALYFGKESGKDRVIIRENETYVHVSETCRNVLQSNSILTGEKK